MTVKFQYVVAFGILLLFGSDTPGGPQTDAIPLHSGTPHQAANRSFEKHKTLYQELMLVDRLPLGSSYDQVKSVFPGIGKLRSDSGGWGYGSWGLTEAVGEWKAFGRSARLEFNFKSGRLSGYFACLERLDLGAAKQIYEQIKGFYNDRFGSAYEEQEKESDYASVSSYWYTKDFDVNVVNNIHDNVRSDLCWGFQTPTKKD